MNAFSSAEFMPSVVAITYSSIVPRSRGERSSNALYSKAGPRATAAVGYDWTGHIVWPVCDAGWPSGSGLRLEHDDDNRAKEGLDDLCFEGVGLEAECKVEEEGSVWLATTGDEWEKRLRKRSNGSRLFARPAVSVILALFQEWDTRRNDDREVVVPVCFVTGAGAGTDAWSRRSLARGL